MTVPIALARSVRQTLRGHDVAASHTLADGDRIHVGASTTITVVQDR